MTELESLHERIAQLERQLADANHAIDAFALGSNSATPVRPAADHNKLRRSEAVLRAIFDGSQDAILLADDHGKYVDANPAACVLFGLSREHLMGRSLIEFAAPDYDATLGDRDLRQQGRMRGRFPLQVDHGSQRVLDHSEVASVSPGLHLLTLRDITEKVAAEHALRAGRELLEEAQAVAHVGSWTSGAGLDDAILWSRECYRIFGVQEGTPVTVASFFEQVHPDDRDLVQRASRDIWERDAPYDIAHRLILPDGSVRWVQEHAIVERDSAGRGTRMVGTVQDVTDRHLAVEALRTSEAEFRLLAEAMPQIVWITRPDGANVYFNRHWIDYTGMTLEESLGDGWSKPFHPDDKTLAWEAWQNATTTHGTYSIECRLRRRDGAYRWWLIRGVPVKDASGAIVKWFGTCTDINSLKQGEERLRVLHDIGEMLRTAVDPEQSIPATLRILGRHLQVSRCTYATVDVDGVHCEVSPDYTDGCGSMEGRRRLAELGAERVTGPMPVVVRNVDVERSDVLGATGIKAFVSCPLIAHGTLRAVMSVQQLTARDWTAGEVSIVREVTDRCWAAIEKSGADRKLRENESLLRIAGQTARLGGFNMSLAEGVTRLSDEACAIHEVPVGTVFGFERAMTSVAPEYQQTLKTSYEACLRDGTPFDDEVQIVTGTNRRVWVRAIGNAERDSSGTITAIRGALQDIDKYRKLQDQFRQAQKMEAVGRLAGGVAHDFNNLLTVILSCAELSIEGLLQGDPLYEDLDEIRKAGHRATALTRQLLAFSRQQVLAPRVLDVDAVLTGMKPMLGRLLGADIHLTLLSSQPVGSVIADPQQIEQVVMNLAVNARDAMPRGGNLTIETSNVNVDATYPEDVPVGAFVMLAVTDSGTGMSEATRARIFEPFFTTKEVGKGTGLGLATVFGIVQQSGGYVRVYSELEHGTAFKVYLPRTDRVATALITPSLPLTLGGLETILLVEDEDQVRAVSCSILRKHGYNVLEASNGGEAFLVSKDFPARINLLLTDVIMPRLSGRKLAEQLAEGRPEMRVLFTSGYTDDTIIHHGVLDSGVAFLQKPFTPHALLRKVREALDADPPKGAV